MDPVSCRTPDRFPDKQRISLKSSEKSQKWEKAEETFDIVYKHEDDKRFPDFAKIQGYVCTSTKTEMFYERINETV